MDNDEDPSERFSAAFAEFMTPDENGEPLLLSQDLKHVLQYLQIPVSYAPKLLPLMDPESKGTIEFETFLNVSKQLYDVGPSSDNQSDDSDQNYVEDDNDDENDDDYDDSDDEEYTDSKSGNWPVDESIQRVFNLLAQGNDKITVESLQKVNNLANIGASRADMEKMVQRASSMNDFKKIWQQLN